MLYTDLFLIKQPFYGYNFATEIGKRFAPGSSYVLEMIIKGEFFFLALWKKHLKKDYN